jgi:hypothetical protein
MAPLEQRVAYLEGRGEEHAVAIAELRADIRDLRGEVRDLRTDMNRRFDQVDVKFMWMIGFQFATLMAVVAALLNVYFR